jgi:hypothetical protein
MALALLYNAVKLALRMIKVRPPYIRCCASRVLIA